MADDTGGRGGLPAAPQRPPGDPETPDRRDEDDRLQDESVEESFPASDPPSGNAFD